jgi:hypothetical protein
VEVFLSISDPLDRSPWKPRLSERRSKRLRYKNSIARWKNADHDSSGRHGSRRPDHKVQKAREKYPERLRKRIGLGVIPIKKWPRRSLVESDRNAINWLVIIGEEPLPTNCPKWFPDCRGESAPMPSDKRLRWRTKSMLQAREREHPLP